MMLRLSPDQEFIEAHWIGDRLAVQIFRAGVSELLMLGPGDNQVRNITSWREAQFVTPVDDEENPKPPVWPEGMVQTQFLGGTESVLYLMAQTGLSQTELWMVDGSGQLRRQRFDFASIRPSFFRVLPNGLIAVQRAEGDRDMFTCLDPDTARLVQFEVVEPRGFVPLEVSRPWGVSDRMADRGYTLNALVLQASESDDPQLPALVTKDGVRGGVMPKQQAVWFVDSFGLYLCDLMPVETEKLEALKREAVKAVAISRAKQVGIGMMIYGADYDDYLPRSGDWENAVLPYLRSRDLTNGFVYLGNGENLSNLKDPANQVLGYIDTPYGRAIVRMDSSVK